jgi:cytochrome c peroxidase
MGRDAPTLLNRAFSTLQFWNGRGASLEEVTLLEILIDIEDVRKGGWELTPAVREEYREGFQAAFGSGEVTYERAAMAIAAFMRMLLSGNSAFDRYEHGGEGQALSEAAKRGLTLFRTKARCNWCHIGFNFTDEQFHNLGVGWDPQKQAFKDPGRFVWTGREEDRGAFKTPTLRDVAHTAPYMHDGSLKTLGEVVDLYNRGGNPNPYLDPAIQPLQLSDQEKADLVAFLRALSGDWHEADYTSSSPFSLLLSTPSP